MKRRLPFYLSGFITMLTLAAGITGSAQNIKTGKGYINISKGTSGGTFEPGDILEIRATIALSGGVTITNARYVDTIPTNTTFISGSLKLMTNEGVPYRSFTDTDSDDAGMYNDANKTLKIHTGASNGSAGSSANSTDPASGKTRAPSVSASSQPSFGTSTCIIVASYRIQIDAVAVGTVITTKGGAFYYTSGSDKVAALSSMKMTLAPNLGLCINKVSRNSVLENEGTFGTGTTKVRSAASTLVPTTGYTFTTLNANSPDDGSYTLANNTSANGSTNNSVSYGGTVASRTFHLWEIGGDHSGASNTALGNAAATAGSDAGYMLVVNASYANGVAINQPISNLCDETYYEFSAWFKNICRYCGTDIHGKSAFTSGYATAFPGDSSGVKPNLSFEVNGEALYTTGDIAFSGQWVKKGFVFKTKSGQSSISVSIRNNSSGGGGNDWAMDDISLSICGPGIAVTPNKITDCDDNYINMAATISYFQNNFGAFIWEKSVDGGANWTTTAESGAITPQNIDGQYQYTVNYPPLYTTYADSGSRYRVRVASNMSNLSSETCSYIDTTEASLTIFDCQVLPVDMISFNGIVVHNNNVLQWRAGNETHPVIYDLQRSTDGLHFTTIATVNSLNKAGVNMYSYTDKDMAGTDNYYRILVKDMSVNKGKFTNVVVLHADAANQPASIQIIENPFHSTINLDITTDRPGALNICLYDLYGRPVKKALFSMGAGTKKISLGGLEGLVPGVYILKADTGSGIITRKIMKE